MSFWTLLVEEKTKGVAGGICERDCSRKHAHPSGHTELDQLQSTSNVPWFTADKGGGTREDQLG